LKNERWTTIGKTVFFMKMFCSVAACSSNLLSIHLRRLETSASAHFRE